MTPDKKRDRENSIMLAKTMGIRLEAYFENERKLPDEQVLIWMLTDGERTYGRGGAAIGGLIIPHKWYNHKEAEPWREHAYSSLCPDFYAPGNMMLAFHAITWHVNDVMEYDPEWLRWWFETSLLPHEEAQRLWLDKAVELVAEGE